MRSVRLAPKRPVNLSLNSKVLEMAKAMGMNISQTVDELLTEAVLQRYRAEWQVNNQEAIDQYNARIARDGTFAERIQTYLAQQATETGTPR